MNYSDIRHDLHNHPGVSGEEHYAHDLIAHQLPLYHPDKVFHHVPAQIPDWLLTYKRNAFIGNDVLRLFADESSINTFDSQRLVVYTVNNLLILYVLFHIKISSFKAYNTWLGNRSSPNPLSLLLIPLPDGCRTRRAPSPAYSPSRRVAILLPYHRERGPR